MEPTDFQLLEAWRAGDASAGQRLVRKHTPLLHRFFVTKAPEVLEDLIQATFLAAVESRDKFEGRAAFGTFVLAIGRRVLLKHFRKQSRGERAMELSAVCAAHITASPSLGASSRQELGLLLRALRQIPIEHQIVLELHYWEEMPIAEIAEVLEVAPGTVKSRMARARDALRAKIEAGTSAPELQELRRSTLDAFDRWADELKQALSRQR